ncbi:MAG TPA: hypothetical protein VEV87_09015 [Chitinophagaceae bacterium]|nr:hypothetical protein [Chitinophagaceae bacterium]
MEEKNLTEKESLAIIQQMINTAKHEQKDDGKGWIIWGWLLFLVSLLTYINLQTRWFSTYYFWTYFGGVSLLLLLFSTLKYYFFGKKERAKTYTGELFQKLNVGFFISIMFIIFSMNTGIEPMKGFPLLMGLYGFWILIYGTALDFRPSIIAAYVTWALGFAAFFVKTFDWVMILHGAAALFGYIIPGHIAHAEFKKLNR